MSKYLFLLPVLRDCFNCVRSWVDVKRARFRELRGQDQQMFWDELQLQRDLIDDACSLGKKKRRSKR